MDHKLRGKMREGLNWPLLRRYRLDDDLITYNPSYVLSILEAECAGCGVKVLDYSDCSYCLNCGLYDPGSKGPKRPVGMAMVREISLSTPRLICRCCHE